jgi:hypothetical protein
VESVHREATNKWYQLRKASAIDQNLSVISPLRFLGVVNFAHLAGANRYTIPLAFRK